MKKNNSVAIIAIISIICGILIAGIYYINTGNDLVRTRNLVKSYEANIQTELQTRFEKVPNLVEIVKGAAKHEQDIIDSITEARAEYNKALLNNDTAQMLEADNSMKLAFSRFEEKYPDIAAMDLYKGLMDEYSGIEAAVAVERRNYNNAVRIYNDKIEVFPTCIVARMKGFERIPEFKASEEANNPVKINMED